MASNPNITSIAFWGKVLGETYSRISLLSLVETYSRISLLSLVETYSRISLLSLVETYSRISLLQGSHGDYLIAECKATPGTEEVQEEGPEAFEPAGTGFQLHSF